MFIIDFDDTLFDSHAFKKARFEILKSIGVTKETFFQTYKQAYSDDEGNFAYNDRRHAQFLGVAGFDENEAFNKLSIVSNRLSDFLFTDAVNFLQFLKKYNQPIILLSLGDPSFQEFKIKGTQIENYFNHIFAVAEPKDKVLSEIFKFEKVKEAWFINDKVNETKVLYEKFPQLKPVLKISPSIEMSEYINSGYPFFNTLSEIQKYVEQSI